MYGIYGLSISSLYIDLYSVWRVVTSRLLVDPIEMNSCHYCLETKVEQTDFDRNCLIIYFVKLQFCDIKCDATIFNLMMLHNYIWCYNLLMLYFCDPIILQCHMWSINFVRLYDASIALKTWKNTSKMLMFWNVHILYTCLVHSGWTITNAIWKLQQSIVAVGCRLRFKTKRYTCTEKFVQA